MSDQGIILKIQGKEKSSTEITYDDLVILYHQFIDTYGKVPSTNDGKSKYNMPQQRIIKKILQDNNISYNDFIKQFGKYNHVRSSLDNYDDYINRFKQISIERGKPLMVSELFNNQYGLPSANWLVKNCPDKTVKTYNGFLLWCGFSPNKFINTKENVGNRLKQLEKELNRPITSSDIIKDNVGFSIIVVKRLWGSLINCKKELGLLKTLPNQPKPFEYYKENLLNILNDLQSKSTRKFISWKDIESHPSSSNHKAYLNSFRKANVDLFAFIKEHGFLMNPSNFSYHYTFDSGERVVSSMEYDFTEYLNSLGYKYKYDYSRDYMYKNFIHHLDKSRINCDYYINNKVIEIAGIIHNLDNKWDVIKYSSKQEIDYQKKLLYKKQLLESNHISYLFLFPEDFINDGYKNKFLNFI